MKRISIINLLAALACFGVGIGTMMGVVQQYVYFVDPINEMVFAVVGMLMGVMFTVNIKK